MKSTGLIIDLKRGVEPNYIQLEIRRDDGERFFSDKLNIALSNEELLGKKVLFTTFDKSAIDIEFERTDDQNLSISNLARPSENASGERQNDHAVEQLKNAYLSPKGNGIIDLIPFVKDLPSGVKTIITVLIVLFVVFYFINE